MANDEPQPIKDIKAFGIALANAEPGDYCPVTMIVSQDQYRALHPETEINWNQQATMALRDLAVDSGIALSVIARAAKGEVYYKLRVPDRCIEEYKKWRQVYSVSKRIGKSLR